MPLLVPLDLNASGVLVDLVSMLKGVDNNSTYVGAVLLAILAHSEKLAEC